MRTTHDHPNRPEQRLYDAIVSAVDPFTFDGRFGERCLIGQILLPHEGLWEIAQRFGVNVITVVEIDNGAFRYGTDLEGAKAMARRVLGIEATP